MFMADWRAARGDAPLRHIAIVDTRPTTQYLYPEFLLFQRLFEARGIRTTIADPSELTLEGGIAAARVRPDRSRLQPADRLLLRTTPSTRCSRARTKPMRSS